MRAIPGEISAYPRIPVADYVAFDLETTGLSPDADEILEVALVRFLGGEPVERWSSLVNPGKSVPLKTVRLTHIDPAELPGSPVLIDLIPKIQEFRGTLPLVGHNSDFDAAFLAKHIQGFPGVPLYDTLELSRIAVPGFRSYKLADIAREMGVAVSEAHRAYDDAEVSGVLFRLVQSAIVAMQERTRLTVREVMGKDWAAARLFAGPFAAPNGRVRGAEAASPGVARAVGSVSATVSAAQPALLSEPPAAMTSPPALEPPPGSKCPLPVRITRLLETGDKVTAVNLPLSSDTAAAVARAAAIYARQGKRVLLLGFPEDCLPADLVRTGRPQDFICLARLAEAAGQAQNGACAGLDVELRRFLAGLYRWVDQACDGAFAGVQMGSAGYEVAPEVACSPTMECRRSCSKASPCFYLKNEICTAGSPAGRGLAAFTSVHSALGMAAPYDAVLVWSSHDLGRAWQGQEPRIDLSQLREAARQAGIVGALTSLEMLHLAAQADLGRGGSAKAETVALAAEVADEVAAAALALRRERQAPLPEGRPDQVDPPMLWRDLHFLEACVAGLRAFARRALDSGEPGGDDGVPLVEQSYGAEGRRGAVLVRRAIWPASAALSALSRGTGARLMLLSDIHAAAARSEGGRRALGLDFSAREPVDLREIAASGSSGPAHPGQGNILLVTLDAGRAVAPQAYAEYLKTLLVSLGSEVRKGLLVTFPSRALLKETYSLAQPVLEAGGIAVYGQGIDGGHRVVEHLEEDESIVFALAGTGPAADDPVPRCLVLARVPFAPPNPLDELRRAQVASSGGDGFLEVNVRPSALSLRAYVQRMAKSGQPCAVVLADPKLLPRRSSWGQEFMAAFDDLGKLTCPERELVSRASAHLKG